MGVSPDSSDLEKCLALLRVFSLRLFESLLLLGISHQAFDSLVLLLLLVGRQRAAVMCNQSVDYTLPGLNILFCVLLAFFVSGHAVLPSTMICILRLEFVRQHAP